MVGRGRREEYGAIIVGVVDLRIAGHDQQVVGRRRGVIGRIHPGRAGNLAVKRQRRVTRAGRDRHMLGVAKDQVRRAGDRGMTHRRR